MNKYKIKPSLFGVKHSNRDFEQKEAWGKNQKLFGINSESDDLFFSFEGIFSIYEPSPTIRGVNRPIPKNYSKHDGDAIDDLSKVRPLTTKERTYIQTFPENFQWFGTKTELEQIIGNAVPVNLAKFVGECIQEFHNDSKQGKVINHKAGMIEFEFV